MWHLSGYWLNILPLSPSKNVGEGHRDGIGRSCVCVHLCTVGPSVTLLGVLCYYPTKFGLSKNLMGKLPHNLLYPQDFLASDWSSSVSAFADKLQMKMSSISVFELTMGLPVLAQNKFCPYYAEFPPFPGLFWSNNFQAFADTPFIGLSSNLAGG